MIDIDKSNLTFTIKLDFDSIVKPFYDFLQESVDFSKSCGEYEDIKADVDGFINSKLTNEDKIAIMNNIKEVADELNLMTTSEYMADIIQKAVSIFVKDKYGLITE